MLLRHSVLVLRSVLFGSLLAADPPADEALDILAFFVFRYGFLYHEHECILIWFYVCFASCSIPFDAWVAKRLGSIWA